MKKNFRPLGKGKAICIVKEERDGWEVDFLSIITPVISLSSFPFFHLCSLSQNVDVSVIII